jgi:hypothetical protein
VRARWSGGFPFLQPGETCREEVEFRFGSPWIEFPRDRVAIWRCLHLGSNEIVVLDGHPSLEEQHRMLGDERWNSQFEVVLEFDDERRLVRWSSVHGK